MTDARYTDSCRPRRKPTLSDNDTTFGVWLWISLHVVGVFLQRFPRESRLLSEEHTNSKNDAELVHFARTGNREAYGELIRRYQHSIWGLAWLLGR
jgi:hypothetical protein